MKAHLNLLAGAIALTALAASPPASADTVTLEVVHAWGGHKRFHEPIAEAFMKEHPDIKIKFRAPMSDYDAGHQKILREALTNNLPDIWYSPYHLLPALAHTLSARGQIVELTPLLEAEGKAWIKENYSPNVLGLGQVDGTQWAMPFNASTPIGYYNLDLVKKAGGDPDNLPTDWDGVIELAKKINALGNDVDGIAYAVSEWSDDWLWQALIYNHGGSMMNDAKTKVTFGDSRGKKAIRLLRRLVTEAGMPIVAEEQTYQQFTAGKLGILFGSTAEVRGFASSIDGKFGLGTNNHPIADKKKGGLPTGGNAAVILSGDPAKQKAAWEFIKFATGPAGQKMAVLGSGYMPTNLKTANPEYLGNHYAENPNWTTSMKQWPIARKWFGYPGNKGPKIWREQQAVLAAIMRGDIEPEAGLEKMVKVTERLLKE